MTDRDSGQAKPCRKCGGVFSLDDFPKHSKMADGHLHRCKRCSRTYNQQHHAANRERHNAKCTARYQAHKTEIAADSRAQYASDAEYRQRRLGNAKASRARRLEACRAASRAWYERNKAKANAASMAWNRAHPELRIEYQRRMRARQKGATVIDLTFEQWTAILEAHEFGCHYCGTLEDIGMDHQVLMQRGGGHTASNVVPCCRPCNTSKGTQTPTEWARGWLSVA